MQKVDYSAIFNWRNPLTLLTWCGIVSAILLIWFTLVPGYKPMYLWMAAIFMWTFTALLAAFMLIALVIIWRETRTREREGTSDGDP